MKNDRILWIVKTAIFISLLVICQVLTSGLSTIITGSLVNLLLIISCMTNDVYSAVSVGIISPILAKIIGIGPLWPLIPFIILGNIVLVLIWQLISNKNIFKNIYFSNIISAVLSAIAKFLVLYLGIVKIMIPYFLNLPEKKAAMISAMFSFPQIITALIGGAIAVIILPQLNKILNYEKKD